MPILSDAEYDDFKSKIEALCALESGLSGWEVDFVEDISHRFDEGAASPVFLSERQQEKLNQLYERAVK
jgi:hypothetical protein